MKEYIEAITSFSCDFEYKLDLPLAHYSTFKIGGNADIMVFPRDERELVYSVKAAKEKGKKYFILGNGSNTLFSDNGYRGVVISTERLNNFVVNNTEIEAYVGASLTSVSKTAQTNSLAGLAFAYGIPGSVGGAIYMNAGAYGGEMSDVVIESRYYDPTEDKIFSLVGDEHKFSYRHSFYIENPDFIILSAKLKLSKGNTCEILDEMKDYMARRRDKQPLEYPSAGSVFKRCPGHFAGKLIEDSGLKGYTVGGAQVSEKHAGFIINIGGAKAKDVMDLIEYIKETVYKKHGVNLECEVKIIGE